MTKNEFLRELENSLKSYLSQEDINEVLSDYGDIFDNGRYEGKSDDEISNEIGSPACISRTILDDINNNYISFDNNQTIKEDISNLASMSKRLGAYIIDIISISLIISIMLIITSFSFYSMTTGTSKVIAISHNGEANTATVDHYRERTTKDKNGEISKVELFNYDKRIFEGTKKEYNRFLISKGIDFKDIIEFETVAYTGLDVMSISAFSSIIFLLVFFGFSNIITAFELWIFKGYTLGKWMLKIKVQRIDDKNVTFWDAFLRDVLIKNIGNAITSGILNIASFIWGCATPEHKTVHDLGAKTKVINMMR